ncbi:MAG: DUF898 domain-containing protein [Alphaproteobacteria bacterium]|nr:DUF898 domain-containing protein [Alphaproteobacteria bacterium]
MSDDGDDVPGYAVAEFEASFGEFMRLTLATAALTVVTLGIYRFWAKTRVRRFLWSHTRVGGTPLEYTGTGVELFVGFLVVFVGLLLPIGVLFRLDEILGLDVVTQGLINLLLFAIIGFLSGIAIFRARRYRLSRTRWRGIRGSMTGSSVAFVGSIFGQYLPSASRSVGSIRGVTCVCGSDWSTILRSATKP